MTTTQKFIKSESAGHEISGVKSDFNINEYKEKLEGITSRLDSLEEKIEKGGKK